MFSIFQEINMFKKIIPLLLIPVISTIGYGQEFPQQKSENHLQINGTNIFMVPPENFDPSADFKGFQNPADQTSMIMAVEIPGPYNEVIKGFNDEILTTRGMELLSKKEVKIATLDGLIIEINQPAGGTVFSKQILVYGNEKESTLINGVYLKDSVALGERIKASILSTVVDTQLKINPREALDYVVDETAGSLKFHSVMGNGMLFNRDLKTPTESADKATLIIQKSTVKLMIEDQKQFCVSLLKQYPGQYELATDNGVQEIEINGLKGYEFFAKNKYQENEELYQIVLFNENGSYYVLLGTYVAGNKSAITDIKNVIQTFSIKSE